VFRATRPPCGCRIALRSILFFLKTLVFPKNQEKDVWHALLSFQGTASPASHAFALARDGAVPPAPDRFDPSSIGPIRLAILGSRVKRNFASRFRREATAIAGGSPLERSNPCGEAGL
jgi:hypothetical protein